GRWRSAALHLPLHVLGCIANGLPAALDILACAGYGVAAAHDADEARQQQCNESFFEQGGFSRFSAQESYTAPDGRDLAPWHPADRATPAGLSIDPNAGILDDLAHASDVVSNDFGEPLGRTTDRFDAAGEESVFH